MPALQPRRSKIGKHLSYPLKFSEITSSLGATCDGLAVEVSFWDYHSPRPNEVRDRYSVLEVDHSVLDGEPRYRFTVSAVPRHLRAAVHALLVPAELERIRAWLLALRTPYWRSTYHALRFSFDPADQSLLCYEHDQT